MGNNSTGVLGTDLLTKLDVRIDFATGVAIVPPPIQDVLREINSKLQGGEEAFDHGDAPHFKEILGADIVWVTPRLRLHGREAVMAYLQREYFEHQARIRSGHIAVSRSPADANSYQIRWEYRLNVGNGWREDLALATVHRRDNKEWEILSVEEGTASQTEKTERAMRR